MLAAVQSTCFLDYVTDRTILDTPAGALRSSLPSLIAQLEAESAARAADCGSEPEPAGSKPDGPLVRTQPLVIVG